MLGNLRGFLSVELASCRAPRREGAGAGRARLRGVLCRGVRPPVGQLYLVTGDLQDAEDVVQEALTRAAVRWERLRDYAVPEAWVRRVAMNLTSDGFRRARRRLAVAARLRLQPDHPATLEGLAVTEALQGCR